MFIVSNERGIIRTVQRFRRHHSERSERGASMVSYALLVGLIAVVGVAAMGAAGNGVASTMDGAADGFDPKPAYSQEKSSGVDGEILVTFGEANGTVYLDDVQADGWQYTVTKQTDRRINLKFTNATTGETKRVNGWLNKKDTLKTKTK